MDAKTVGPFESWHRTGGGDFTDPGQAEHVAWAQIQHVFGASGKPGFEVGFSGAALEEGIAQALAEREQLAAHGDSLVVEIEPYTIGCIEGERVGEFDYTRFFYIGGSEDGAVGCQCGKAHHLHITTRWKSVGIGRLNEGAASLILEIQTAIT